MATLSIKGYEVGFPYETPYPLQQVYMEKVLTCLDEARHGVLESPTGTGKTLCLFAPVAAWTKRKKALEMLKINDDPYLSQVDPSLLQKTNSWKRTKVWYTSRTHSQIAQTVAEVRRCNIEKLEIRVMGARDQLCINPEILAEKESYVKTVKCKELVKENKCKYYWQLKHDEKILDNVYQPGVVLDIEDLVAEGKKCGACPYYLTKQAVEKADLVLLPYNYIIDKESREANGFDLSNDVVIFDEGHNVPSTCEESYEFTLTSADIALGTEHMRLLMESLLALSERAIEAEEIQKLSLHVKNAETIMRILRQLEDGVEKLPMSNELLPVELLHKFFQEAGINGETSGNILRGIEDLKSDATNIHLSANAITTLHLLEKIVNVTFGPTIGLFDQKTIDQSFKYGISNDADRMVKSKKISLYCFNPSFGIRALLQLGVQSIIITSGTLSPLKTFIHELGLPEPVTLENGHIARKCQVPFAILGTGVNNEKMDSTFKNRTNSNYKFSLGMTLTNLISSIPDGVLLLFASYAMMQNLKEAWESENGIWTRLSSLKRVFIEPRGGKEDFINCMENYRRAIDAGNGAILMGVLRGKISEGMDFKDQYCRGVFIIGVPFPPIHDPRVKGKQQYAESLTYFNPEKKKEEKIYNNPYFSVEAMKATNQAIGRVIRHGRDYGAIILVDYRFAWPSLFLNISAWLRGETASEKNFPETKKLLREFFKDIHTGKLGIEEIRCQRVDANGCPISGNISFEEYDHKTAMRSVAPNITASLANKNASTRSTVVYDDNSPSSSDILASYRNLQNNTKITNSQKEKSTTSALDALESSRSTSIGYREYSNSDTSKENNENNKRKYLSEEGDSQQNLKSPCLENKSTLVVSGTQIDGKSNKPRKLHLFNRAKIQPLTPSEAKEPENVVPENRRIQNDETLSTDYLTILSKKQNCERQNDDIVQQKIKEYISIIKRNVEVTEYQDFTKTYVGYCKGSNSLLEVITILQRLTAPLSDKNIFKGFEVCVKTKDKKEWLQICERNFS